MQATAEDRTFMLMALRLALQGEGCVEPNPMVGAVLVKDGAAIGEGHHARFGGPHAEIAALGSARKKGCDVRGATLYVTLEPCAHHGKTPPCAPAVVKAGVRRVVMAVGDPMWRSHAQRSKAAGRDAEAARGLTILQGAGIETAVGVCLEEAAFQNAAFFKKSATGLPLVIAKWAMSADGKIATSQRRSRWISCPEARELVHKVRGRVDAVIVGSRTAHLDDPLLTCRDAELRRVAARVVLCGASVPAVQSQLIRTIDRAPVVLAFPADKQPEGLSALAAAGCELLPVPPAKPGQPLVDVPTLLKALGERGASNVLVEGGSEVLGSFFDCRAVDRVMIFVAPFVMGGAEAVTAVGGRGAEAVSDAIPFVGGLSLAAGEAQAGRPGCVTARVAGSDLLVEAWTADPLQWVPQDEGGRPA